MSKVVDISQPRERVRRSGGPARTSKRATAKRGASRWRVGVAIAAVEAIYILGLVIAVPLGRGAVALTIALAFLLALFVNTRLTRSP